MLDFMIDHKRQTLPPTVRVTDDLAYMALFKISCSIQYGMLIEDSINLTTGEYEDVNVG